MEDLFLEDSFDNEAYELQKEIELYIGKPLTLQALDEDEECGEWKNNHHTVWKELFISGLDNGETI